MKSFFTLLLLFIINVTLNAQDYSDLKDIPLKDSVQCLNAEPKVLECAEYLLATPYSENLKSLNATLFLLDWMEKTPAYAFSFDKTIYK